MADQNTAPAAALLDILHGSWKTQALCAAADLRLADHLAAGGLGIDELAAASGCHAPSLQRLVQALQSLGVCRTDADGCIGLTPMGACLRSDGDDSLRSWVLWWGRHLLPVWAQLPYSIQSGREARSRVTGSGGFEQLGAAPELAELFNAAMGELTRRVARSLTDSYDFAGATRIADIGGGRGELLAAVLHGAPASRGVLFDLPHALACARDGLAASGVLERCELVEGDFFQAVPAADVYLLKSIVHDWDDERAAALLATCRRAMPAGARLLLVEHLMPEQLEVNAAHQSLARLDLSMLVALGARERSEAAYRQLLHGAGLGVSRILPVAMDFYVIEAVPL